MRAPLSRPSSRARLNRDTDADIDTPSSVPSMAPSAATSKLTIDEDMYINAKRELVMVQRENHQLKKSLDRERMLRETERASQKKNRAAASAA